jgi:hypothetical protein
MRALRLSMTRSLVAMAALATMLVPGSSSAATTTVRYVVAVSVYQSPRTNANLSVAGTTFAPTGAFTITPTGTTVRVTIADDVTPGGSFLFNVCPVNDQSPSDYGCGYGADDRTTGDICYTGPKTLTGVTPGNPVGIIIFGATSPCRDSPTTGTVTVVA